MLKKITFIGAALCLIAVPAVANASPDADNIKQVWEYYYNGDGATLGDAKLCLEIGKDEDNKHECSEVAGDSVPVGTTVSVWQAYMVVSDNPPEFAVQAKLNGTVRTTKDIAVKKSLRYRTWRTFRLNKAGTWVFTISHDDGELKTLTITAIK